MHKATILSDNYVGYAAQITFYPENNPSNPIDLGTHLIPYEYNTNYYYGTYELYFEYFNSTCTVTISA
jgi:hypothetical protein